MSGPGALATGALTLITFIVGIVRGVDPVTMLQTLGLLALALAIAWVLDLGRLV